MKKVNALGLAMTGVISVMGLSACGGGDSGGTSVSSHPEIAYPWTLFLSETDNQGKAVLQKVDRVIVDNVMYNKDPVRIVGGQPTLTYYDKYYFNNDFFFVQKNNRTQYGRPTFLTGRLTNTLMEVSPYNTSEIKYFTQDYNFKIIDLSGKPVSTAPVLSGQHGISFSERFPSGAKCRSLSSINYKMNIGNAPLFFMFDSSDKSKTAFTNFNSWQADMISRHSLNKNALDVKTYLTGQDKVAFRSLHDTKRDEYYMAAMYQGRVYNIYIFEVAHKNVASDVVNHCIDYNNVATDYITQIAKRHFAERPVNRIALENMPDMQKVVHDSAARPSISRIEAALEQ